MSIRYNVRRVLNTALRSLTPLGLALIQLFHTGHRHLNTELLFGACHRPWSAVRVREISPTTLTS